MKVATSRLVLVVFLFNILFPSQIYAQQIPSYDELYDKVSQAAEDSVHNERLAALYKEYDNPEATPARIAFLIERIHQEEDFHQKQLDHQKLFSWQGAPTLYPMAASTAPVWSAPLWGDSNYMSGKNFLEKIKKDELTLDEIVNYMDPVEKQTNHVELTAFAAEVLFYTLLSWGIPSEEETKDEFFALQQNFLVRLEKRALYRLQSLQDIPLSDEKIMALGTLRCLLWAIHNNYVTLKKPDPNFTRTVYKIYPTKAAYNKWKRQRQQQLAQSQTHYEEVGHSPRVNFLPTYQEFKETYSRVYNSRPMDNSNVVVEEIQEEDTQALTQYFTNYMEQFLKEINSLKNSVSPADIESSKTNTFLQLTAEYAVRYAVLTAQIDAIRQMVSFFEYKPVESTHVQATPYWHKHETFGSLPHEERPEQLAKTPYSTLLNQIFLIVASTVTAFPTTEEINEQVLQFLKDMATGHSVPVRFSAVQAAALLSEDSKKPLESTEPIDEHTMKIMQKISLPDEFRKEMAAYTADLYLPLTDPKSQVTNFACESYGLNSQQARELADKLAIIYEQFLPLMLPVRKPNPSLPKIDLIGQPEQPTAQDAIRRLEELTANLDPNRKYQLQRVDHLFENARLFRTYPEQRQEYKYRFPMLPDEANLVLDSKDRVVLLYKYNAINEVIERYADPSIDIAEEIFFFWLGGKAIVYGIKGLNLTGRLISSSWRGGRAAVSSIGTPTSALRSFRVAFTKNMRFGSGFASNMARNGVIVATTRTERVSVVAGEAERGATGMALEGKTVEAGTKMVVDAPVSRVGTSYVFGQTMQEGTQGFWKRVWNSFLGRTPKATDYTYTVLRPNGQMIAGKISAESLGALNNPLARQTFWREARRQMKANLGEAANLFLKPLSREERFAIAWEQRVLTGTSAALRADMTANSLNGRFTYWAYDGEKWIITTPDDFYFRGKFIANTAEKTAAKVEELTRDGKNFYEILGVSETATKRQIRQAWTKLCKQNHPDLHPGQAEELQKMINEVYETLSDPTKRSAYDAALSSLKTPGFNPVLPTTSQGFSLAITANTPIRLAAGEELIDPISGLIRTADGTLRSVKPGLGLGATNWAGEEGLSIQVMQHLLKNGQSYVVNDLMPKTTSLFKEFWPSIKFLGKFSIADWLAYPLFKDYQTTTALKIAKQEMNRYGDVFKEQPAQDQREVSLTAWDEIMRQDVSTFRGASIGLPYLFIKQTASEFNIGNSPFITDAMLSQLAVQAKRLQISKAIEKGKQVKDEKTLNLLCTALLEQLDQEKEFLFSNFPKEDYKEERKQLSVFFYNYKRDLRALMDSKDPIQDRAARFQELTTKNQDWINNYLKSTEPKQNALLQEKVAPNGVDSWYDGKIRALQIDRQNFSYSVNDPNKLAELNQLIDNTIAKLEQSRTRSADPFLQHYKRAEAIFATYSQEKERLLDYVHTAWAQLSKKQKEKRLQLEYGPDMLAFYRLSDVKQTEGSFGTKAREENEALFDLLEERINRILHSKKHPDQKRREIMNFYEQYANDVMALYNRYLQQPNEVQSADEQPAQ